MHVRICLILSITSVIYQVASWLPRIFARTRRIRYSLRQKAQVGIQDELPEEYVGPATSLDSMAIGWGLDELGVDLFVGPSVVADGMGLFLALQSDVEEAIIPAHTVLCGYAKGVFSKEASIGDKDVGFEFSNTSVWVVYNKQILPLQEVIRQVAKERRWPDDFTSIIAGHIVKSSTCDSEMTIYRNKSDQSFQSIFVPHESSEFTLASAGMYANDLAYSPTLLCQDDYDIIKQEKNVLGLIWRLENDGMHLRPSWPVVLTYRDVRLRNHQPMEMGVSYGWKWWEFRKKTGKVK